MDTGRLQPRGRITLAASLEPDPADAGSAIYLQAYASCDSPCDLSGHRVILRDAGGEELGALEFVYSDGTESETGTLDLTAPRVPGTYSWTIDCPPLTKDGITYDAATATAAFTVEAHHVQIAAWDIPTAIVAAENFRMKVGVRCSSACDQSGHAFAIMNNTGREVARAHVSDRIWPGTDGLHFVEVELRAPSIEGLHEWRIVSEGYSEPLPHSEGLARIGVRVVRAPECVVKIEAVDRANGAPLRHARITMHPYHAAADEAGRAELSVAKGAYRLFVAQAGYANFAQAVEVASDQSIRAELDIELKPERN